MNELLDSLFGLDDLAFSDEATGLSWARPLPGWAWLLIVAAAGAIAWWSYRRLTGPVWARAVLGVVRALVLVLLVVLLSGPQLSRPNTRVERDWVVFLVDRSASMQTPDAEAPDGAARTRDEQLRAALGDAWPDLARMGERRHVLWLGFGAGAYELPARDSGDGGAGDGDAAPGAPAIGVELGRPDDRRTSLRASIEAARQRTAGRRLSGIVILSDGASMDEPTRRTIAELRRERVKVVTVPLGSSEPLTDLAIRRAEAPAEGFLNDVVPVRVALERTGGGGGESPGDAPPASARLRIVDEQTDLTLAEQRVRFDGDASSGTLVRTLRVKAEREGERRWRVELEPDGADLVAENNTAGVRLTVVDRPVRVAHFDGYPRWEFRYLRNLLLRESSITSSSMLLAADRRFVQEGDETLSGVPTSPEAWAPLDVVVMGDVRASLLSERQLEQLADHVAERGAGLLWIGGASATPGSWRGTPLADLLPFRDAGSGDSERTWPVPVTLTPGSAAGRIGVLGATAEGSGGPEASNGSLPSGWPSAVSDPDSGWSQLRWVQRIEMDRLKPAVEVIAWARPSGGEADREPTPAAMAMRFGAGRVVYVATDEVWRYRYGRGEALPERFWIPTIRYLARASLGRADARARLTASPRVGTTGEPVRLSVRLIDPALAEGAGEAIGLRVRPADEADAGPGAEASLSARPADRDASVPRYLATWVPDRPGRHVVSVERPGLTGGPLEVEVDVYTPDDERNRPQADHELLADLRARLLEGDGIELSPGRLAAVGEAIPREEIRIESPPDVESLWDRPVALAIVLGLLTVEWVSRKLLSLA